MLTGSMALMASNPIKTTKTETPIQGEVVSREGSEALRAVTFPGVQQTPAVPTEHNIELDAKLLKFCDNDEERKNINDFLLSLYNRNGSYYASVIIQQYIDLNIFLAFLDGNIEILKRFDQRAYDEIDVEAMQKVTEKSEPIKQWLNENYFKAYYEPLGQFDRPPEAEEVSRALDNYVKNDPYNLFGDKERVDNNYTFMNSIYERKLSHTNYNSIQKGSNYVAYQISCADYLLFYNLLKSAGAETEGPYNKIDSNLSKFIFAIQPKAQ